MNTRALAGFEVSALGLGCMGMSEYYGRAIEGRREHVVLATKFGNVRGTDGERLGTRGDREYVHQACDAGDRYAPAAMRTVGV